MLWLILISEGYIHLTLTSMNPNNFYFLHIAAFHLGLHCLPMYQFSCFQFTNTHVHSLNNYTKLFSSCMELENLNDCQSNPGIISTLFFGLQTLKYMNDYSVKPDVKVLVWTLINFHAFE